MRHPESHLLPTHMLLLPTRTRRPPLLRTVSQSKPTPLHNLQASRPSRHMGSHRSRLHQWLVRRGDRLPPPILHFSGQRMLVTGTMCRWSRRRRHRESPLHEHLSRRHSRVSSRLLGCHLLKPHTELHHVPRPPLHLRRQRLASLVLLESTLPWRDPLKHRRSQRGPNPLRQMCTPLPPRRQEWLRLQRRQLGRLHQVGTLRLLQPNSLRNPRSARFPLLPSVGRLQPTHTHLPWELRVDQGNTHLRRTLRLRHQPARRLL